MSRHVERRLRGVVLCDGCDTYVGRNLLAGEKYGGCCPVCGLKIEEVA